MLPDHRIFEPVSAQEPEAQRLPASACPKLRTIPAVLDSVVGPHPDHDPVFAIGLVEALTAAIGPAIGRDPLTLTPTRPHKGLCTRFLSQAASDRLEERRAGNGCVKTCRSG